MPRMSVRQMMEKTVIKGSVVFASAPFPEGHGRKTRPVVILTLPNIYNDVVVAEIVTRPRPDVLPVKDTAVAGLHTGSGVRMRLCTVTLAKGTRPIGRLSREDYTLVKERISTMML